MKTTINIAKTITTTEQIEVQLPLFTKEVSDYFINYYAIYNNDNNKNNISISIYAKSKDLFNLCRFVGITSAIKGEVISSREFANILSDVTEEIISLKVHARATTTNDEQDDYYISEQTQLLNSHE